jgi:hypothetical protein
MYALAAILIVPATNAADEGNYNGPLWVLQ